MIVCSGFYSYFVCFSSLSIFYSSSFRSIAFSLTRSDICAGNSLSVPQYTAVPLFYTDWCLLSFSVFLLFTAHKWWQTHRYTSNKCIISYMYLFTVWQSSKIRNIRDASVKQIPMKTTLRRPKSKIRLTCLKGICCLFGVRFIRAAACGQFGVACCTTRANL